MKSTILFCILMLFECSLSFGATICKTVEYPDRNEIVCIGDEKAVPVTNVPVKPSQAAVAEKPTQSQVQTANPSAAPVVSVEKPLQAPASTAPALQPNAPASKPDTAAEHLARRRGLAERNSRNLMNHSSASAPQVK
ncbi:MAG TPA: hypothetical protein DER40_11060 [Geobacter sp.]|nr:hypothetical protein [Geobacter sp.]HCE68026.1 hypothetical protein [Geobacter sp.]